MKPSSAPIRLSEPMTDTLQQVQDRSRRTQLLFSVLLGLLALLLAMSAAMLVDWSLTLFDTFWRSMLTVAAVCVAGAVFGTAIAWGYARRRTLAEVAGDVDQAYPVAEERWATMAELANAPLEQQRLIHTGMLNRLEQESAQLEPQVDPQKVVSRRSMQGAAAAVSTVAGLLLLALLLDWQQMNVLVRRFWAPTASISATQVLGPGEAQTAAVGEPFTLSAQMRGRLVDEATLRIWTEPDQPPEIRVLSATGEQQDLLTHRIRRVSGPFEWQLRAGDGQTSRIAVDAVRRPEIAVVRLRVVTPDYTETPPEDYEELPRTLTVLEGSRLQLEVAPEHEVSRVELQTEKQTWKREHVLAGERCVFEFVATRSDQLTLLLTNSHGLQNRRPPQCRLHVRPDQKPRVDVISPTEEMTARPDDQVPIEFEASDDWGISKVELVLYSENAETGELSEQQVIDYPLQDRQGATHVRGAIPLDLAQLQLQDGDAISYGVRVYDTRQAVTESELPSATAQDNSTGAAGDASSVVAGEPGSAGGTGPVIAADESAAAAAATSPSSPSAVASGELSETGVTPPSLSSAVSENSATAGSAGSPSPSPSPSAAAAAAGSSAVTSQGPNEQAPASSVAERPPANGPALPEISENPVGDASEKSQTMASRNADIGKQQQPTDLSVKPGPQQNRTPAGTTVAATAEPKSTPTADSVETPDTVLSVEAEDEGEGQAASVEPEATSAKRPSGTKSTADAPDTDLPDRKPAGAGGNRMRNEIEGDPSPADDAAAEAPTPAAAEVPAEAVPTANPAPSTDPAATVPASAAAGSATPSGTSPPPNPLIPRTSEFAQSGASRVMRLQIDSWAGNFSGQRRRKLEQRIAPLLKAVDGYLETAENRLREGLDEIEQQGDHAGTQDRRLHTADQKLNQASKAISQLREMSMGTVYAFVGLQLGEIADSQILGAQSAVTQALQESNNSRRQAPMESAWQQVVRARQRLSELTRSFDQIRRDHELADGLQQIQQMYQAFVEGAFEVLAPDQARINNYNRSMAELELSDEYMERLQEVLEMRQKLAAEFLEILTRDPRLLKRFMDNFTSRTTSLRDRLTLVTLDQRKLQQQISDWRKRDDTRRESAMQTVIRQQLDRVNDLVDRMAELQEDFDTWAPLQQDVTSGALGPVRQDLLAAAAAAQKLQLAASRTVVKSTPDAEPQDDPAASSLSSSIFHGRRLLEQLEALDARLLDLTPRSQQESMGPFLVRRLAQTRRLMTDVAAWNHQLEQLDSNAFHQWASVEQHRIAEETSQVAAGLDNIIDQLSTVLGIPEEEIPADMLELADKLLQTLDKRVGSNQLGGMFALRRNRLNSAVRRTSTAASGLEDAETMIDELFTTLIRMADQQQPNDPTVADLDDPTLDQLLLMLAREDDDLATVLGIPPRPNNLQTMSDFLRPGSGGGASALMAISLNGQGNLMQQAGTRRARIAQQQASDLARRSVRQVDEWNRLASELQDRLLQGQDRLPPERYRTAIDQYFEAISRMSDADR